MKRRLRSGVLAAAGLATICASPTSEAARLPEWAKTIAATAPELPSGVAETASINLFSETRYTFDAGGELRVRRRVVSQALRSDASGVRLGTFAFDEGAKILSSRAWHLPADAKRAKKTKAASAVDLTPDDFFLTDTRVRYIVVDGLDKGSLVFFEFEAVERAESLTVQHLFLEGDPTRVERLVVEMPEEWSTRHAWLRTGGPGPLDEDGSLVWELRDIEASEWDELGVSPADQAALLVVGLDPPEQHETGPVALRTWSDVARWYEQLAAGRATPSPEVEAIAQDLVDTSSSLEQKLEAVGHYVRDSVRYVAKEIGVGSYRPSAASDTLTRLWGDCKDKGTLFQSILRAAGVDAYPILVNATREETVSPELPSLGAFNHFVVGVAVPAGVVLPSRFGPATVTAGELGRLVVVDTTNDRNAVGAMPAYLAGKTGLVVAGERSTLLTLPANDAGAHRIERRLVVDLEPDGSAVLQLVSRRQGEFASMVRGPYAASASDFRRAIERWVEARWPDVTIESMEFDAEDEAGSFVLTASLRLRPPSPEESETLSLFPGAMTELPRVSLRRRTEPVFIGFARTLRFETEIRGAAEAVVPDESHEEQGEGWAVRWRTASEGSVLRGSWEVELTRRRFEPDAFEELNRLWKAARRGAGVTAPRR